MSLRSKELNLDLRYISYIYTYVEYLCIQLLGYIYTLLIHLLCTCNNEDISAAVTQYYLFNLCNQHSLFPLLYQKIVSFYRKLRRLLYLVSRDLTGLDAEDSPIKHVKQRAEGGSDQCDGFPIYKIGRFPYSIR